MLEDGSEAEGVDIFVDVLSVTDDVDDVDDGSQDDELAKEYTDALFTPKGKAEDIDKFDIVS